jgi:predicted nucleotidyltransferase
VSFEDDLELIDAVTYGDAFDCAVAFDEVWRYSRVKISRARLRERVRQLALEGLLGEREGLYFLAGREHLVYRRDARLNRALRLKKRARLVSCFLQHAPFVRGIVLTGSVAADDAEENADVDVLMIVAKGRIGLSFLLLATLSRVFSRRVFCPNYYVSEAHLSFPNHDRYIAREIAQAELLTSGAGALHGANSWVEEHLPNSSPTGRPVKLLPGGALMQRIFELPFEGRFGSWCEQKACTIVKNRLSAHYGSHRAKVPEDVQRRFELGIELRFHGAPRVNKSMERYEESRRKLADCMRGAGRTESMSGTEQKTGIR